MIKIVSFLFFPLLSVMLGVSLTPSTDRKAPFRAIRESHWRRPDVRCSEPSMLTLDFSYVILCDHVAASLVTVSMWSRLTVLCSSKSGVDRDIVIALQRCAFRRRLEFVVTRFSVYWLSIVGYWLNIWVWCRPITFALINRSECRADSVPMRSQW